MEVRDSRRLTGPNILTRRPGAVLDVQIDDAATTEAAVQQWRRQARRMLDALGWGDAQLAERHFHGGLSLWIEAPIDVLYAATEVNEWAWEAASAVLQGDTEPDLDEAAQRLAQTIAEERQPAVLTLQAASANHGIAFLWDDDEVSVGMGQRSESWRRDALPNLEALPWHRLGDLPLAIITGTNGKTTTVRLLKAMVQAAGKTAGVSSTDGCWVDDEEIGQGDYSGPGGARLVLRDRRVDIALLETARGGMLRRGLGVERADVALITNVAEDHLGEWGIHDLGELTDTKLIVTQAAEHLVLNADDAQLRQRGGKLTTPITWFGLDSEALRPLLRNGDEAWTLIDGQLSRLDAAGHHPLIAVDDVPITLGGAARHNVANALGAIAVARHLGLDEAAICAGLRNFDASAESNPGRLNRFTYGEVTAIVDFAHNPHGLTALLDMAQALPAKRRCILVGQAGDRDDEAIRELPRLVWQHRPDRIILKELTEHLRGRQEGDVTALMADELRQLGAPDDAIGHAPSELAAVRQALSWARDGDLLLLISHAQRPAVLELLSRLHDLAWRPGQPLPEDP